MKRHPVSKLTKMFLALALLLAGSASPVRSAPQDGSTLYMPLMIYGYANGLATLTGVVRDASNGTLLDNAEVCYGLQCDNTDDSGRYILTDIPSGNRTLIVSSPDYSTVTETIWVVGLRTNERNFALVSGLVIGGIYMRMVATWVPGSHWPGSNCGGVPCENDLDGLLWMDTPIGIDIIAPDNTGDCTTYPNACHEYDARHGSGPETIAIKGLNNGTQYYYGVLNVYQGVQGVPTMSQTSARVHIYDIAGLDETFEVPPGTGEFWYVFKIDSTVAVTPTLTFIDCLTLLPATGEVPQCPAGTPPNGKTYYLPPEAFVDFQNTP